MNTKKELVILLVAIVIGGLLGPMFVFLVGQAVLGPYDQGSGMASFYSRFWQELARADSIPWLMLLAPYLFVQWVRLLCIPFRHRPAPDNSDQT